MPSHVTIETKFSDEMYDCIQQNDNSMMIQQQQGAAASSSMGTRPQHLGTGNLHLPQPQSNANRMCSSNSNSSSNGHHAPFENGTNTATTQNGKKRIHNLEIDQRSSYDEEQADHHHNNYYDHNDHHNKQSQHAQEERESNENLLGTAFCTFMTFATVQTIVALFAKSEAMLGDSAAMIVDALTYLFNWYAERKKAQFETTEWADSILQSLDSNNTKDPSTRQRILDRTRRKQILQLELVPPLISVSTLITVTGFVLHQSISVLVLDVHRSIDKQGNPNIHIMMYFSIANLGLDLINVANFAKAKHLFGYETNEYPPLPPQGHEALRDTSDGDNEAATTSNGGGLYVSPSHRSVHSPHSSSPHDDDEEDEEDQDHTANLNMCSAYTHVFADTLRSIAVLVAASISELVHVVTPEEADAAGAVVVSALILLSLIPLVSGLVQSSRELRLIRAEEKQDELLFSSSSS